MKVVHHSQIPAKPPFWPTVTTWLLLDRLDASPLIWGIVGTVLVLWWVLSWVMVFGVEEPTKIDL